MEAKKRRYLTIIVAALFLLLLSIAYWIMVPLWCAYRANVEQEIVLKVPQNATTEQVLAMLEPNLKSSFSENKASCQSQRREMHLM